MPTDLHDVTDEQDTAVARSVLYGFAAGALALPTEARLAELLDTTGPLAVAISGDDPLLGPQVRDVLTGLQRPLDQLRRAHTEAFPPIDSRDHPPYESAYASGDIFVQTEVMADVAAFYRAHGLQVGGRERERPDHICVELEFMAFMARKEAHALGSLGPEQVEECRRTQAHFLRDHLGGWAGSFGERIGLFAADEMYRYLGDLVRTWVELDCVWLEVTPRQRYDAPHPPPPPDDGSCGIDASGMAGVTDVPGAATPGSEVATPVPLPRHREEQP